MPCICPSPLSNTNNVVLTPSQDGLRRPVRMLVLFSSSPPTLTQTCSLAAMHSLPNDDWNNLFSGPLTPAVFANITANGVFPPPPSSLHQDYSRTLPPRDPMPDYSNDHAAWSLSTSRSPYSKQLAHSKLPPQDAHDPLHHHKPHRIVLPVSPQACALDSDHMTLAIARRISIIPYQIPTVPTDPILLRIPQMPSHSPTTTLNAQMSAYPPLSGCPPPPHIRPLPSIPHSPTSPYRTTASFPQTHPLSMSPHPPP